MAGGGGGGGTCTLTAPISGTAPPRRKEGVVTPELGVSVTRSAAIITTEVMAAFRRLGGSEASIYCSSSCTRLDHNQSVSAQKHGHRVCYTRPQPEFVRTETWPPCTLH